MNIKTFPTTLLLLVIFGISAAADARAKEPTSLDLGGKNVDRFETSQSQIGPTNTTVFYTIKDHHVVVVLKIDNTKKPFAVTGTVFQFAADVTAEGIGKWINNQHSDGLFPDVPEPKATDKLPADACKSGESKLLGQETVLDKNFDRYSVEIKLTEVKVNDGLRLKEFKDTVKVYSTAK